MRIANKLIALILALTFILSLCACGTFKPAIDSDSDSNTDTEPGIIGTDTSTETETDSDIGADFDIENSGYTEDDFTVALRYNGEKYIPDEEILVYWKNANTLETCQINKKGFAGTSKLDGDYRVTLSHVPEGMAYNPNVHEATNDNKHIIIDIYDLVVTKKVGTDQRNPEAYPNQGRKLNRIAVYSVTLNSKSQTIYFDFTPRDEGDYKIESWMDTTAEQYNPYCEAYTGSIVYKRHDGTVDGGGAEGLYTKNFLNGITVSKDMIGNVLTFGIHVDSKNADNYPVDVVFAITLNDGFEPPKKSEYTMYAPEDPDAYLDGMRYYGSEYEIKYPEKEMPGRNTYYFKEENFQLWTKESGGDGYYHVYDMEKYSRDNYPNGYEAGYPEGYGPILYANISVPCRFLDRPFTFFEIESKPLSIKVSEDLKINYKHFIEGYDALAERIYDPPMGGYTSSYYCFRDCPCHPTDQIYNYACPEGCTNCLPDCRQVDNDLIVGYRDDGSPIYFAGLSHYVNNDGGVAVTEELKTFLYRLSVAQRYFADGDGWVETHPKLNIDSSDEAQWLFACYYYELVK